MRNEKCEMVVRRIKIRSAAEHNEWRCPKVAGSKFPILNFPHIAHLTVNDKDFSLALEMTIRENPISPSLLVTSHLRPLIPSY